MWSLVPLVVLAIQLTSLSLEFFAKTLGLGWLSLLAFSQASFLQVMRMLLMSTPTSFLSFRFLSNLETLE